MKERAWWGDTALWFQHSGGKLWQEDCRWRVSLDHIAKPVSKRGWIHSKLLQSPAIPQRLNSDLSIPIQGLEAQQKFWSEPPKIAWITLKRAQSLTLPPLATRYQVPSSVLWAALGLWWDTQESPLFSHHGGAGVGKAVPHPTPFPLVSRSNRALAAVVHSWMESLALLTPMEPYCTDDVTLKTNEERKQNNKEGWKPQKKVMRQKQLRIEVHLLWGSEFNPENPLSKQMAL